MILNVFAEGFAGSIFVKHLQWYIHVLFLSLVMWDDAMWCGDEWAFTCFFSGIGSKARETLRVSFGSRSDLVRTSFRTSFGLVPRTVLKELGHLNAWCCYWSGAWCCCWCCWCYRWCYTGVFRARRFVASVPLDMTIWKEVHHWTWRSGKKCKFCAAFSML